MADAAKRGAFILFEGLDRTGKTTQSHRLHEYLKSQGYKTHHMHFPVRTTEIGKSINSYLTSNLNLDDRVIHLLFSANRWEIKAEIDDRIKNGEIIVCDRFAYSGACYSAAKEIPGMGLGWCWTPDVCLPEPDMLFFLDLQPEEAKKRSAYGEERYETLEFQMQVRSKFLELISRDHGNWQIINANQTIDAISEVVNKAVNNQIEKTLTSERRYLQPLKAAAKEDVPPKKRQKLTQ